MANHEVKSWERRQAESEQAWQAFKIYRDYDDERRQAKVVVRLGKSRTLIERWAKRHGWSDRVVEYDRWRDNERLKALVKGQVAMRERHATLAAAIIAMVTRRVENMTDEQIGQLKPQDIAALLRVSTEVEMRARAVDITENVDAPFEVRIHTYVPGKEPEPLRELVQLASSNGPHVH